MKVIELVESQRRKKEAGSTFKGIMAENFPNLGRGLDIHIHEGHRSWMELKLQFSFGSTEKRKTNTNQNLHSEIMGKLIVKVSSILT